MKILFDINHPAHVHYFRNVINRFDQESNEVIVVSRNKELEHELLDIYGIEFISRGKGGQSFFERFFYHVYAVLLIVSVILSKKVDVVVSFMHPYAAQAAWLTRRPTIVFSDTEKAMLHHVFTTPFADQIHSPFTFNKDLGKKHHKFNSFMELSYLNTESFKPEKKVLDDLKIKEGQKFAIVRFVSRKSLHDWGHAGISKSDKVHLVERLSENVKVFISSEEKLPKEIQKYKINISPEKIHDLLYRSALYVGESATMAAESILLGTPAVFIDNDFRGYIDYLKDETKNLFQFEEDGNGVEKAISKSIEIISGESITKEDIRDYFSKKYIRTDMYIYDKIKSLG